MFLMVDRCVTIYQAGCYLFELDPGIVIQNMQAMSYSNKETNLV